MGAIEDYARACKMYGTELRKRRKALGMSVESLAKAIKVPAATLYSWEAGSRLPRVAVAGRIVKVLARAERTKS